MIDKRFQCGRFEIVEHAVSPCKISANIFISVSVTAQPYKLKKVGILPGDAVLDAQS